jgi:uncharacterized protein (DUF1330 family)
MFIDPTNEYGRLLFERNIAGPVVMLNLLRFRESADYSDFPDLAPSGSISGRDAYDLYVAHTLPFLTAAGGAVQFLGNGGRYFIGPLEERWDVVMLVRYPSLQAFLGMAENGEYLAGLGHRAAALEDSRLLPVVESPRF